jgi:hypothetical protein
MLLRSTVERHERPTVCANRAFPRKRAANHDTRSPEIPRGRDEGEAGQLYPLARRLREQRVTWPAGTIGAMLTIFIHVAMASGVSLVLYLVRNEL